MWSPHRLVYWSPYSSHWKNQSFLRYEGSLLIASTDDQNSAAYWLGDAKNDSLQRIYGVSFPDKKQMTEYKTLLAEAARRDHRRIGRVLSWFVSLNIIRNKICFSSMNSLQEAVSSFLMECESTTPSKTSFARNIMHEVSRKWAHPTCTTRNSGKPLVIGRITRMICSH